MRRFISGGRDVTKDILDHVVSFGGLAMLVAAYYGLETWESRLRVVGMY